MLETSVACGIFARSLEKQRANFAKELELLREVRRGVEPTAATKPGLLPRWRALCPVPSSPDCLTAVASHGSLLHGATPINLKMRDVHLPPAVVWEDEEEAAKRNAEPPNEVADMYRQLHAASGVSLTIAEGRKAKTGLKAADVTAGTALDDTRRAGTVRQSETRQSWGTGAEGHGADVHGCRAHELQAASVLFLDASPCCVCPTALLNMPRVHCFTPCAPPRRSGERRNP